MAALRLARERRVRLDPGGAYGSRDRDCCELYFVTQGEGLNL